MDQKPELLDQMLPVTGDIVVAWELQRLNIPFIDEWSYLEPDDIERSWEAANNLSVHWWDESLASTAYEGFALADAARQELVYPFEACLNARLVYERIFQSMTVDRISGFFLPETGVIRTGPFPTHRAVRSVAQAVLFYAAEKNGIPLTRVDSNSPLSKGTLPKRKISLGSVQIASEPEEPGNHDKVILVYDDGMSSGERSVLVDILQRVPACKAVVISRQQLETGVFVNTGDAAAEKSLTESWLTFAAFSTQYHGEYPEIFANPHLQFQFKRIWDEMRSAAGYGELFSAFLDMLQPALVLFGHEAFTIDRVLVRLAQTRSIPTAAFLHGGIAPRFGFRGLVGDADSLLVWNDLDVELLTSYGVKASRLKKIGSLRYQAMYDKYKVSMGPALFAEGKRGAKTRLGLPGDRPVVLLITAAINAGFAAPVANPQKHLETVGELVELFRTRQEISFIIKAHPTYDYYEIYRKLQERGLDNFYFLEESTLEDAVNASDVCLLVNYCTTALLEAMLNRLPLLYLETAIYPLSDWRDNVSEAGIQRVQTVPELGKQIDSLLIDPLIRLKALDAADRLIGRVLDSGEASPDERLLAFVKTITGTGSVKESAALKLKIKACADQEFEKIFVSGYREMLPSLNSLAQRHNNAVAVFVLAYQAGTMHLLPAKVLTQFRLFRKLHKTGGMAWRDTDWAWLHGYIAGYCKCRNRSDSRFAMIRFLSGCIVQPQKLISMPRSYLSNVIEYLLLTAIGNNRLIISAAEWLLQKLSVSFRVLQSLK